jgi:hypothetical protein
MSNIVIAVGGSGAKLLNSLIHLSAAGLLPENRLELGGLLVDPDSNNGNVHDTQELYNMYRACKLLNLGKTNLFSADVRLDAEVWTPLKASASDTLSEIFRYRSHAESTEEAERLEADLLDTMFEQAELDMSIKQGFRGRPAIGATVLAGCVDFAQSPWRDLKEYIKSRGSHSPVHVLLAGSVFGGSGASGVPTLVRLLADGLRGELTKLRLGLMLFLPFFQFRPVPNEAIQADPSAFPMATAEALKYYHERGFLTFCHSIYAVGEETAADLAIAAVGAEAQKNEAHFIELIAGMGAMRFFSGLASKEFALEVAARSQEGTITWSDLPYGEFEAPAQILKLQQMAVFAVAYRYIFYPGMIKALNRQGAPPPFWVDHVERAKVKPEDAGKAVRDVYQYVDRFLTWLLQVSTPRRQGFTSGLVDPNVFGVSNGQDWRLKTFNEFREKDFGGLLLNRSAKARIDDRLVYNRASGMKAKDQAAEAGRLIRVLYDACAVE